jgi:hypothetical protein
MPTLLPHSALDGLDFTGELCRRTPLQVLFVLLLKPVLLEAREQLDAGTVMRIVPRPGACRIITL